MLTLSLCPHELPTVTSNPYELPFCVPNPIPLVKGSFHQLKELTQTDKVTMRCGS